MNMLLRIFVACPAVAFCIVAGCTNNIHTVPGLLGNYDQTSLLDQERFQDCNAYYCYDELFIEPSYSIYGQSASTLVCYRQKVKINNEKGLKYGTILIPVLSDELERFDIRLCGPTGKDVPLNLERMREEYLESNQVVVQQVVPGAEITVDIAFEIDYALPFFEYHFVKAIPSKSTTFIFSEYERYQYRFKTYNFTGEHDVDTAWNNTHNMKFRTYTYRVRDIFPVQDVAYIAPDAQREPRVSVVLNKIDEQSVLRSWQEIANTIHDNYNDNFFEGHQRVVEKYAEDVNSASSSKFEAADSILRFVQQFSLVDNNPGGAPCDLDEIFAARKGDMWAHAALLNAMYRKIGIVSETIVTRSSDDGGFDERFVALASLKIPLTVVTIDKQRYVAYPFKYAGKLGEYPDSFDSLSGLSLNEENVVTLPKSTAGRGRSSAVYTLSEQNDTADPTVDLKFYGSSAYKIRSFLHHIDPETRNEFFQEWLTETGSANELKTCHILGLDTPGTPLYAKITFANINQKIRHGKVAQYSFANLFKRYFDDYDTLREENVVIPQASDDSVEIRFISRGDRASVTFACDELKNGLFSAMCGNEKRGDTLILRRCVSIFASDFDKRAMKAICPDFSNLNKIQESNIIVGTNVSPTTERSNKKRR